MEDARDNLLALEQAMVSRRAGFATIGNERRTDLIYAWTVKVVRSNPPHYDNLDAYTFTVAAANADDAIKRALRQAKRDSGYKRVWQCTELSRGGWLVS